VSALTVDALGAVGAPEHATAIPAAANVMTIRASECLEGA
jgi:hypothetical protein